MSLKIVFPEINNPNIQQAIKQARSDLVALPAASLADACQLLARGEADAMIAGIDHSTRDVILAARDHLGATAATFSASVYLEQSATRHDTIAFGTATFDISAEITGDRPAYLVADAAACKNPTADQLFDICVQTHATAAKLFAEPRLALLSFSTHGSARDASIDRIVAVVTRLRAERPDIIVDGELQLDCAINPTVAAKKAPDSPVAGRANVLICPDLNSGNLLYKAIEQFGGYTAAGPLLQGFKKPISDLSRGSTAADVALTIDTIRRLCE